MSASPTTLPSPSPRPVPAILVGGLIAGIIDMILAYNAFGWNMPKGIASGLLGRSAFQGGTGVYILGLGLHYFIALSAATVYYVASRKLEVLREYPLICGAFFGIAEWMVMNLIVLPLSAIHSRGPFMLRGLAQGLIVHILIVGLPIAYSVRVFSK